MVDYSTDFIRVPSHVWLNAASEGPLPRVSAEALQAAVGWKMRVHELTISRFVQVPVELKQAIGRMTKLDAADIILGNSATYGMHLLAHGLPLKLDDEVLLMCNDFPSDILPWLHLNDNGVKVRQLKPKGFVLTLGEIEQAITSKTRVVCLPLIHTFSGIALDIPAIGALCRAKGIIFVVNVSQAVGSFDLDLNSLNADAVVCAGYKWMLGPYGCGFCWVRPKVRAQLNYDQAYWISLMNEELLKRSDELVLPRVDSARKFDVFGTANFFNYVPWKASIDYLLSIGMPQVDSHNHQLVNLIKEGLDRQKYVVFNSEMKLRSNLIVFSVRDQRENAKLYEYLKMRGYYLAFWKGNLRVSPHVYNTHEDITSLIEVLNEANY